MKVPAVYGKVARIFDKHGFQCFLVGGAVRDMLLGREIEDYDIATDALTDDIVRIFRRVVPTGVEHGTVTVLFGGTQFEVTTFRIDGTYSDGRRPDSVAFTPSIYEDLRRRDFTINAIAYDLVNAKLLDPHHGISDLRSGIIRAINNPEERFREDGLRPMRACRFAAQFGFTIEAHTKTSIPKSLATVARVSVERVRDEIVRMLQAGEPSRGLRLLEETGLLALFVPELHDCAAIHQPDMVSADLFSHLLAVCERMPKQRLVLRLAALFHDISGCGLAVEAGRQTSARIARSVCRRLKFPNKIIHDVAHLITHQIPGAVGDWTETQSRLFIARCGPSAAKDILSLRVAREAGMIEPEITSEALAALSSSIDTILARRDPLTIEELEVNGKDVMQHVGLAPSPQVGLVLKNLLERVLRDPTLNRRAVLLGLAQQIQSETRPAAGDQRPCNA